MNSSIYIFLIFTFCLFSGPIFYNMSSPFFSFLVRDHCHRQRTEGVDLKARKKLIIASILCLVFMVCEIIGEYKEIIVSFHFFVFF